MTATHTRGFAAYAEFATADPDYAKLIEITNSIVPFANFVGVRVTEMNADHAVAELRAADEMLNHLDTVHAGALFLAADYVGAAAFVGAAAPYLAAVEWMVVRDARSVFLKPAKGRVRAVATVDDRAIRTIAAGAERRVEVDGKARLYDDNDVLVAKFGFDYLLQLDPRD
jgi:uncharacterized protein (TIGR00369 family)